MRLRRRAVVGAISAALLLAVTAFGAVLYFDERAQAERARADLVQELERERADAAAQLRAERQRRRRLEARAEARAKKLRQKRAQRRAERRERARAQAAQAERARASAAARRTECVKRMSGTANGLRTCDPSYKAGPATSCPPGQVPAGQTGACAAADGTNTVCTPPYVRVGDGPNSGCEFSQKLADELGVGRSEVDGPPG